MKQWYVSDENENSDVHVYVRPAACLPNRNQWYYAQAKVHYGSAELVSGGLGPTNRRAEL